MPCHRILHATEPDGYGAGFSASASSRIRGDKGVFEPQSKRKKQQGSDCGPAVTSAILPAHPRKKHRSCAKKLIKIMDDYYARVYLRAERERAASRQGISGVPRFASPLEGLEGDDIARWRRDFPSAFVARTRKPSVSIGAVFAGSRAAQARHRATDGHCALVIGCQVAATPIEPRERRCRGVSFPCGARYLGNAAEMTVAAGLPR